jgi:acetyl-CoA carboxylase alpha subunit
MSNEAEMRLRERLSKLGGMKLLRGTKLSGELARLQEQLDHLRADPTAEEIWLSVELARHVDRPYTLDYVERIFDDFFELHGDRGRADDHAMVTGIGKLGGRTVVAREHQRRPAARPADGVDVVLGEPVAADVPVGHAAGPEVVRDDADLGWGHVTECSPAAVGGC